MRAGVCIACEPVLLKSPPQEHLMSADAKSIAFATGADRHFEPVNIRKLKPCPATCTPKLAPVNEALPAVYLYFCFVVQNFTLRALIHLKRGIYSNLLILLRKLV